jgi:subtilase family serine protease
MAALSAVALLFGISVLPAQAQKHYYPERVIVPQSSVDRPEDTGIAAHTNVEILATTTHPKKGAYPLGGLGPAGGVSPGQLLSFYNIRKIGGANAIAIIDAYDNPNALSDFNAFSTQFNLPKETSSDPTAATNKTFEVLYGGGVTPPNGLGSGWDVEEDLDIQWSHAMAPNAKIYLIEAQSNSYIDLMAAVDLALTLKDVREVSMSFGGGEFTGEDLLSAQHFRTGFGIVYFASSGDGTALYGPLFPAASPNVVSVGGTTETSNWLTGAFDGRMGWEYGGGGPSAIELQPKYQHNITNVDPTYRSTPDVAAIADPLTGVSVYAGFYGGWGVVGGTSVACPVIAGLTNSAGRFAKDSPTELSYVYKNAKKFTDVIEGWNGFWAIKGYDFVTGVGVPNGLGGL